MSAQLARRRREAPASTAGPGLLPHYALQLSISRFASRKSCRKSQFISMRYVAYEPRTATFETLALRTWLKEGRAPNPPIERSGKHSEDTITQVWFPERKIDIKIYAAEDESRRRRPVPRRCLSLGRFVLLAVTVEARWISSTRSVFPRNDSYQATPLKLRLYKKKASIGRIGHDRIGHDRLPMVPANRR